jgi:hypothetical protein
MKLRIAKFLTKIIDWLRPELQRPIIEAQYTPIDIERMGSEEYFTKVLQPLGVRDMRDKVLKGSL